MTTEGSHNYSYQQNINTDLGGVAHLLQRNIVAPQDLGEVTQL